MATTLRMASLAASIVLGASQFAGSGGSRWSFEHDRAGQTPRQFQPEVGQWRVVRADGRNVLAQEASNPDKVFNIALVRGTQAQDVQLSVKFKAVAGMLDQGGGLVWRAKDKNNY